MAHRLTDSGVWEEDWFVPLKWEYKLIWFFVKDKCDNAGIWRVNVSLINMCISNKVSLKDFLKEVNKDKIRIVELSVNRWILTGFFEYQYGKDFSPTSPVHKSALKTLCDNNVHIKYLLNAGAHGLVTATLREMYQAACEKQPATLKALFDRMTRHEAEDYLLTNPDPLQIAYSYSSNSLIYSLIDNTHTDSTDKGTVVRDSISVLENNNISTREEKTVDKKVPIVDEHDLSIGNMDEITEEGEILRSPPPPKVEPPPPPVDILEHRRSKRGPRVEGDWEVIHYWPTEEFIAAWNMWKDYRWYDSKVKFRYASQRTEQAALKILHSKVMKFGGDEELAIGIIEYTMSRQWDGFYDTPDMKEIEREIKRKKEQQSNQQPVYSLNNGKYEQQQHSTFNNGQAQRKRPDDISNIQASFASIDEAFARREQSRTGDNNP